MDAQTEFFDSEYKTLRAIYFSEYRFDNPYHFHELIEVIHIKEGEGSLISGNEVIPYRPNDLIFISSNLPHRFLSNANSSWSRSKLIQFSPKLFSNEMMKLPNFSFLNKLLVTTSCVYIKNTECAELEYHLDNAIYSKGIDLWHSLLFILKYIASDFSEHIIRENASFDFNVSRISPIFEWIGDNYRENVTTVELACLVNMDVSSFCRRFRKVTGLTVREYVNQLRVSDAYSQLITTNASICSISMSVGYSSSSVFCRNFKKIMGISASEVRERWKNPT